MHLLFWVPGYNTILKDDPVRAPSKKSGALQEATQVENQQSNFSIKYFLAFSDFTSGWKRLFITIDFSKVDLLYSSPAWYFHCCKPLKSHDSHLNDPYLSYLGSSVPPLSEADFFAVPMLTTSLNSSVCVGILQSHICTCKATKQHFVGALLALQRCNITTIWGSWIGDGSVGPVPNVFTSTSQRFHIKLRIPCRSIDAWKWLISL